MSHVEECVPQLQLVPEREGDVVHEVVPQTVTWAVPTGSPPTPQAQEIPRSHESRDATVSERAANNFRSIVGK